ncbi:MAG: branched-chain amino acid ABC transporter permease [Desulfobacterales bacterium]|jgi:branched-chain amino acid transport system permease protein|nr:branched-chain amino acid ABC transporter permease [Desulfobacterales bacterium]
MDNLQILISAPIFSLQLLIDGILIGSIFALAAYGMAMVWGVMKIINFAQGEFVILGGFILFSLTRVGFNPFLAIPLAAAALFIVGWVLYHIVIVRIVEKDLFISILATFGIAILLQQLMNQVFGADVQTVDPGLDTWFLFDNAITVLQIKVVSFFIAVALGIILALFMRKTRLGQAIRATAQDARSARILGVDTNRVYATTFAINAAICGAAGALVVMTWVIQPFAGLAYTIRSFMIVIIAGIGNVSAVIFAGLGLGAAENFAGFLLGAEFQAAFIFSLLVVILVWRNFKLRLQRRYLK